MNDHINKKYDELFRKMPRLKERYGICPQTTKVIDHLVIGDDPYKLIENLISINLSAQDRIEELSNFSPINQSVAMEFISAAKDFVQKVESGRARSTDSYNKFKNALKLVGIK